MICLKIETALTMKVKPAILVVYTTYLSYYRPSRQQTMLLKYMAIIKPYNPK